MWMGLRKVVSILIYSPVPPYIMPFSLPPFCYYFWLPPYSLFALLDLDILPVWLDWLGLQISWAFDGLLYTTCVCGPIKDSFVFFYFHSGIIVSTSKACLKGEWASYFWKPFTLPRIKYGSIITKLFFTQQCRKYQRNPSQQLDGVQSKGLKLSTSPLSS